MATHLTPLFLTCLLGPGLAENIIVFSGQSGDNLNISCQYTKRTYHWSKKLWCREDESGHCHSVVSTRPFLRKRTNGNSTVIHDNFNEGVVEVIIKHLQLEDAGTYQCQSLYFGKLDLLQKVRVQVLENPVLCISEVVPVQHSVSGPSSESSLFRTLVILGSFLLTAKVLLLAMIHISGRSQLRNRMAPDSHIVSSSEDLIPDCTRDLNSHAEDQHMYVYEVPSATAVYTDMTASVYTDMTSSVYTDMIPKAKQVYSNYKYMKSPLNQAHWQR